MKKLTAKHRVQKYKTFGRYVREVYRKNKEYLDERILTPEGKTTYEVFRDSAKEWLRSDTFQDDIIEAASSGNPKMAMKGVWSKVIDKMTRSTLITPHGKAYEEQVIDNFFEQATKGEKSRLTRKKRKKTGDKEAVITYEDFDYLGYDQSYSYFEYDDEIIQVDNNPSPKGNNYKQYEIVKDANEVQKIKTSLTRFQQARAQQKNNKILGSVA